MKKDTLNKIMQNAKVLKNKASSFQKEAKKTASGLKDVIGTGVEVSKKVAKQASKVMNKNSIAQSLEATSKGALNIAKGVRTATFGANRVADSIEKASKKIKTASQKFKKD